MNKQCTPYTTISYVDAVSGISYYLAATSGGEIITTTSLNNQCFWQLLSGTPGYYFIKNFSYYSSYLFTPNGLSLNLSSTLNSGLNGVWKLIKGEDAGYTYVLIQNAASSGYLYIKFTENTYSPILTPYRDTVHGGWTLSNF